MTHAHAAQRLALVARLLTDLHRRQRLAGTEPPPEVTAALALATSRQEPPGLDAGQLPGEGGPVVLTYPEAARRLAVSARTVERMVSRGELLAIDIGGCRRVPVAEVVEVVASRHAAARRCMAALGVTGPRPGAPEVIPPSATPAQPLAATEEVPQHGR